MQGVTLAWQPSYGTRCLWLRSRILRDLKLRASSLIRSMSCGRWSPTVCPAKSWSVLHWVKPRPSSRLIYAHRSSSVRIKPSRTLKKQSNRGLWVNYKQWSSSLSNSNQSSFADRLASKKIGNQLIRVKSTTHRCLWIHHNSRHGAQPQRVALRTKLWRAASRSLCKPKARPQSRWKI